LKTDLTHKQCINKHVSGHFITINPTAKNHKSQQATKKGISKNNSKNQKWGRSIPKKRRLEKNSKKYLKKKLLVTSFIHFPHSSGFLKKIN